MAFTSLRPVAGDFGQSSPRRTRGRRSPRRRRLRSAAPRPAGTRTRTARRPPRPWPTRAALAPDDPHRLLGLLGQRLLSPHVHSRAPHCSAAGRRSARRSCRVHSSAWSLQRQVFNFASTPGSLRCPRVKAFRACCRSFALTSFFSAIPVTSDVDGVRDRRSGRPRLCGWRAPPPPHERRCTAVEARRQGALRPKSFGPSAAVRRTGQKFSAVPLTVSRPCQAQGPAGPRRRRRLHLFLGPRGLERRPVTAGTGSRERKL